MTYNPNKKNKIDKVILLIAGIVLISSLYLLKNDHLLVKKRTVDTHTSKEVGRIKKIINKSDRRIGSDIVWAPTLEGQVLYENDHIFTHENSEAFIELDQNVELAVGEKSLIVLEKKKDIFELNIKNGSTQIKLSKGSKLNLRNKGKSIQLSAKNENSSIEVSALQSGEFEIKSKEGSFEVIHEDLSSTTVQAGEIYEDSVVQLEEPVIEEIKELEKFIEQKIKKHVVKKMREIKKIEKTTPELIERNVASVEEKSLFDSNEYFNRKYNIDLGLEVNNLQLSQISSGVKLAQNSLSVRGSFTFKLIQNLFELNLNGFVSALNQPYENQNSDKMRMMKLNLKADYVLPLSSDDKFQFKAGLGFSYWNFRGSNTELPLKGLGLYTPSIHIGLYDFGTSDRRRKNVQAGVSLLKEKGSLTFENKDLSLNAQYQVNSPQSRIPIYWTLGYSKVYFFESVINQFEFQVLSTGVTFGF